VVAALAVVLFGHWFGELRAGAATGDVHPIGLPEQGLSPTGITSIGDSVYVTLTDVGRIARFDWATNFYKEYPTPSPDSQPVGITRGPNDATVWFVETGVNKIGVFDMNTATITELAIPTANSLPIDIALGPDGNLWFTEQDKHQVGRVTPAGVFTEFAIPAVPGSRDLGFPGEISAGPDGNMWFTIPNLSLIGRITLDGAITELPVLTANGSPAAITGGPDGNLWFTEPNANQIGRITPGGAVSEFPILTPGSQPSGITTGADGNLWFTEAAADKIGRITPAGSVTEFDEDHTISGAHRPTGITSGPEGNVWFTESDHDAIGFVEVGPGPTTTLPPTTTSTSTSPTTTLPPTTTSTSTSTTVPSVPDPCRAAGDARQRVNAGLDALQTAFGGFLGGSLDAVRAAVNAQLDQLTALVCGSGPTLDGAGASVSAAVGSPRDLEDQPDRPMFSGVAGLSLFDVVTSDTST